MWQLTHTIYAADGTVHGTPNAQPNKYATKAEAQGAKYIRQIHFNAIMRGTGYRIKFDIRKV